MTPLDTCFVDDDDTSGYVEYMMGLVEADESKENLWTRLSLVPNHYKILLNGLLQFNPYMRWSAKESLEIEVFRQL